MRTLLIASLLLCGLLDIAELTNGVEATLDYPR
jgi:hypothetical protein